MEYEIGPKEKFGTGFTELWQYRELLVFFTWRDIKIKYKQTVLGLAWVVLQPLIMMLIFTFLFRNEMQGNNAGIPYPLFVYSGLLLWNVFSSSLSNAGNSMVTNANIIKKIYFPRLLIPLSSILAALFDLLMTFLVFAGMMFYFGLQGSLLRTLLLLPFCMVFATFASAGPSILLAALNVKYRDFRYVIPFVIQALLFLTPVIYPAEKFSTGFFHYLFLLNPISGPIHLFRSAISLIPIQPEILIYSLISSLFFLLAGLYYFRKTEHYFADII